MKLKDIKTKRVVFEITYPSCFSINSDKWHIADKFKEAPNRFGQTSSGGIILEKTATRTQLIAEIQRASFSVENVSNVDDAIQEASGFLQYILDTHSISVITRLGTRFYFMAAEENEKFTQNHYAKLIYEITGLRNGQFPEPYKSGFVSRFTQKGREIRFGVFSGDDKVIRDYHRYHDDPDFLKPCILLDIDLAKSNVQTGKIAKKGFRPSEFNIEDEISQAFKHADDLAKRYLNLVEGGENA